MHLIPIRHFCNIIVIICVVTLSAGAASARSVRMGVFEVDPLIVANEDGSYGGGVIEVIEYIAKARGWDIQYVPCKFPDCLKKLAVGEIDLMGSISYNAERALRYDYTEETFFMDWGTVYVPQGSEISTIVDLEGKRLAVLRNTIQFPSFLELVESFGIELEIVFVDDYLDVFRFVRDGKADALMVNRIFGERNARDFGMSKTHIVFSPMDIRYAVPKGKNRELIDSIDSQLRTLKSDENSVYYQAVNRMFGAVGGLRIPSWVWWAIVGAAALLAVLFLISLWLRHMVKLRTAELKQTNLELEEEMHVREFAEEELRKNEEKYRNFISSTAEGFWAFDKDQKIIDMNDSVLKMLGYDREEMIGRMPEEFISKENLEQIKEQRKNIRTTAQRNYELEFVRKDGSLFPAIANVTTVFGPEGEAAGSFAFVTDISALKESEGKLVASLEEKEVLLREVHHRVKNNMQIISSLLSLQRRRIKDDGVQQIFTDTSGRIMSMAYVHEQLYQSEDLAHIDVAMYIRSLADNVFTAYRAQGKEMKLEVEVDELDLDIDMLIPCGLILNELLTNAVKHGSSGQDTTIKVAFVADGEDYLLEVSDDGPGLPEGFDLMECDTLGAQLLDALVTQLGGSLSWDSGKGAKFTVRIPR